MDSPAESLTFRDVLETVSRLEAEGADPLATIRPPAEDEEHALRVLDLEGPEAEFRVEGLLGQGGMGRVDLARQRSLAREVALKRAHGGGDSRNALVREALLTGSLAHPNVVPVYELGCDAEGAPLLVMERIRGRAWRALAGDEAFAGEALRPHLEILIAVCNALHYAHSQGVVHRDLKLDNVMVGEFGEVYLVDWGLALRLEAERGEGPVVGTPAYLAPEMLEGDAQITPRTDVYLLGSTLHRILTGTPRHPGTINQALVSAYESKPYDYRESRAPLELAELCNRAMAREPGERPASALEFRQALERYLQHQGSRELSDRAQERLTRLEAALAEETPDPALVATLRDQARFGFEEALRSYPDNAEAEAGLQRCLELAIERELELRNKGLVASLLSALPQPRPELEARLAELEERLRDEEERLRQLEHDYDLDLMASPRARYLIYLGLIAGLTQVATAFMIHKGLTILTHGSVSLFNGCLLGIYAVAATLLRDRLLPTAASRRLALSMGLMIASLQVNHAFAYSWGRGIEETIAANDLLLALGFAVLGAALDRRLLWIAPLMLLMALASALFPGWTVGFQGIGTLIGFLLWAQLTTKRSEAPD